MLLLTSTEPQVLAMDGLRPEHLRHLPDLRGELDLHQHLLEVPDLQRAALHELHEQHVLELPLAGVEVVFEHEQGSGFVRSADAPRVQSGTGGRFELPVVEGKGRLNARDERYASVAMPHLDGTPPLSEPIVVVAPSCDYAGRVVDRGGAPIARARIEITLDGSFVQSRDVGGSPVHLLMPLAEGDCDEEGSFRF